MNREKPKAKKSSKRRVAASRSNGAKSKGPITEAGKRRSFENAIRHGVLSERVVLSHEPQANFEFVLRQYEEKLQPRDGVEYGLLEDMVSCYWRLARATMYEKGLLDEALEKQPPGCELTRTVAAWKELADTGHLNSLFRCQTNLVPFPDSC